MELEITVREITVRDLLDLEEASRLAREGNSRPLVEVLDRLVIVRRDGQSVPLLDLSVSALQRVADAIASAVTIPNSASG